MREVFKALSARERDTLIQAANDLIQGGSQTQTDDRQEQFNRAKRYIDRINRQRQHLGDQAAVIEGALGILDKATSKEDEALILSIRGLLQGKLHELRQEIEKLKPTDALAKKTMIKQQMDSATLRSRAGAAILEMLRSDITTEEA